MIQQFHSREMKTYSTQKSTQKHVHECSMSLWTDRLLAPSSPISGLCLTKVGSSLGEPQLQVRYVITLVPLTTSAYNFPNLSIPHNWNSASFNSAYPAKTGVPALTPSSLAVFLTSSQTYAKPMNQLMFSSKC